MLTPQHGSVDWSPDNSLKSLQHLRQLITLKQREKFFIFAVITESDRGAERERKVRWGAQKKAGTRRLFSQRDGQNLTLNRARLLSPWHRVASDRHARWHVTVLASSRQTRLGNFLPSASKKKNKKIKKKPARRRQRQLTLNNPIRSLTADIFYRGPAFKHHDEQ